MHGGDIYNNEVDIDFSVNLNPCPLSGNDEMAIKAAIERGVGAASYYPDIEQKEVRTAIAKAEGVSAECIYCGSGASELIMAVTAQTSPKKALLIEPCYSGYEHALHDCEIVRYFLREENGFELKEDVLDSVTGDIDILILQNPINPIGNIVDNALLCRIIEKANTCYITVLYDTSFYGLSDSYIVYNGNISDDIPLNDNIFVIGSYTKSFALPGMRMGYVMSTKDSIARLRKHLPEWNISSIAASVMTECAGIVAKGEYLRQSIWYIGKERQYLSEELKRLGFTVYKSDTVFILIKDEVGKYGNLYDRLLDKRILIRRCDDFRGLGRGYYRIAVRGHADNEALVEAIRDIAYEN